MKTAIGIVLGFAIWTVLWLGGNAILTNVFPTEIQAFGEGSR